MVGRVRTRLGATGLTAATLEAGVERFVAMGTRIELHLFGAGDADAPAQARRAIEAVDDALTIHRPSATTALNHALVRGGVATVDDPILLDALAGVAAAWAATEGLFDPTVDTTGDARGGWPEVRVDAASGTVEASHPLAFDFGGFGKGFALDRACDALRAAGVSSAFLSAGESSIAVLGEHPLGGTWPLTVPHPLQPGAMLIELELEDAALSISSTVGDGTHAPWRAPMVRPSDGAIVTAPATAVAVEARGAMAEAMSTALLVADAATAARLSAAARPGRRHRFSFAGAPAGALSSAGPVQ